MFSYEYCKTFKNNLHNFYRTSTVAAPVVSTKKYDRKTFYMLENTSAVMSYDLGHFIIAASTR